MDPNTMAVGGGSPGLALDLTGGAAAGSGPAGSGATSPPLPFQNAFPASGTAISQAAVQKAVGDANNALAQQNRTELNFVFDKQANDMVVKVVDMETRQVVQQIPAEWMTAAARALSDAAPGALVDTKA